MKKIVMCKFDWQANAKDIKKVFSGQGMSVDITKDGEVFLDFASIPGLKKMDDACARIKNITMLRGIEKIIDKPNYDKKFATFSAKYNQLKKHIADAKDAAAKDSGLSDILGEAGATAMADELNKRSEKIDAHPAVIDAQMKLDKFTEKNAVIYNSQFYSAGGAKQEDMGRTLIDTGTIRTDSNYIKDAIKKAESTSIDIDEEFTKFKNLLTELLNVSSTISIMVIYDGVKSPNFNKQKATSIIKLNAKSILRSKNRVLLLIGQH